MLAWARLVLPLLRIDPRLPPTVPPHARKSIPLAIALSLVFPIVGLWYAAPFWIVPFAALFFVVVSEAFQTIPVLGPVLGGLVYVIMLAASATLGATYAWHYNRTGKRTRIRDVDHRGAAFEAPTRPG